MSGVSLPVTRPVGRALLVASAASRTQSLAILQELGFGCAELDEPYAAMGEVCRRPLAYRALILSLAGVYREELSLVRAVKRRFPHIEVWLTHTDGRQGALAEAMRLGADGLLAEDGLHRIAVSTVPDEGDTAGEADTSHIGLNGETRAAAGARPLSEAEIIGGEPVLSADELRALLQEHPQCYDEGAE